MSKQRDLISVSQGAAGDPLFVDAANNRVGIGTISPSTKLHILGSSNDTVNQNNANLNVQGAGGNGMVFGTIASAPYTSYIQSGYVPSFGAGIYNLSLNPIGGNVGIGTSSPAQKLVTYAASGNLEILNTVRNDNTGAGVAAIGFNVAHSTSEGDYTQAGIGFQRGLANGGGALVFYNKSDGATGNFTTAHERVRIASTGYVGFAVGAPTVRIHLQGGTPSDSNSGIAAAWNVHSDYRLKENVVEFSGASSLVSQLRPVKFSWVGEDQSEATTAGFIAHEMAEVAPYSVIGEKDAVNEDGSIKSQAADYSKLVPLLTAALQEALQKIDALETRISALETN